MKFTTLFSSAVLALPAALAYTPTPQIYSYGVNTGVTDQLNVTIRFPNPQPVPNKQLGIAFYLAKDYQAGPSVSTFVKGFDTSVPKFYTPKGSVLEHTFTINANWSEYRTLNVVNWYQWTGNSSFGTSIDSSSLSGLID